MLFNLKPTRTSWRQNYNYNSNRKASKKIENVTEIQKQTSNRGLRDATPIHPSYVCECTRMCV